MDTSALSPLRRVAALTPLLISILVGLGPFSIATAEEAKRGSPWEVRSGIRVRRSLKAAEAEARRRKRPLLILVTHDCPLCRRKHRLLLNHKRTRELARLYILAHLDNHHKATKKDHDRLRKKHKTSGWGVCVFLASDGSRIWGKEPNLVTLEEEGGWDDYMDYLATSLSTHEADVKALASLTDSPYEESISQRLAILKKRRQFEKALPLATCVAAKLPSVRSLWNLYEIRRELNQDDEAKEMLARLIAKYPTSSGQADWRLRLAWFDDLKGASLLHDRVGARWNPDSLQRAEPILKWAQRGGRLEQEALVRLCMARAMRGIRTKDADERKQALAEASEHLSWITALVLDNPAILPPRAGIGAFMDLSNLLWVDKERKSEALALLETAERTYRGKDGIEIVEGALQQIRASLAREKAKKTDRRDE